MVSYLNNPIVLEGKDINDIAKYTRIKPLNKMLQPQLPLKRAYGQQNPRIYPKVTQVIGSAMYPFIGTARATGPSKWGGNSAYFSYGGRPQRSIFRDPDTRLQFPHFQRQVADVIQVPPKMYGEWSPKCSLDLVI